MVALGYVLVGLGAVIAFGWFYAVSSVVADLVAGWRETRHRLRFPKRFGLRAMFAIMAVVGTACFLMQGVATGGVAQGLVMSAVSVVSAAAIVYGFKCVWSDCIPPSRQERVSSSISCFSEADPTTSTKAHEDEPGVVELARWLSETNGAGAPDGDMRGASTETVRSHFRIHLTNDPKGTRAAGFGRF